ncbi:MAG: WD40 repeat domain-containing protein [Chloroflexi bacterium]|nr:WD40 repeat domain-containing protein [Chloroflexota bacterium]
MNNREKSVFRYISALENADFQTVSDLWQQAENDSDLMQALLEIHQEMKGHTTMIPFPISRQMNTHPVRWLRVAVALLIVAGVILLTLTLSSADSPVRSTPLQQGDTVITADNAAQLEIVQTLGKGKLNGAQWSPDGEILMAYGTGGFWLFSGYDLHRDPQIIDVGTDVYQAKYTEDGSQIIYRSRDGISILTLETEAYEVVIPADDQPIVQFDYHDNLIAFIDSEGTAGVWNIERARPRFYFPPDGILFNLNISISDDGQYVAYAALTYITDATTSPRPIAPQIFVSDINTGRIIYTLSGVEGNINDIIFYDGQIMAAVDGHLYTWRLDETQAFDSPQLIELPREELFRLLGLAVTSDSVLGLRGSFWGLRGRAASPIFRYSPGENTTTPLVSGEASGVPIAFNLHPDGEFVAIVTANGHIDVIDVNSGETLISIKDYWNRSYKMIRIKEDWVAIASEETAEVYSLQSNTVRAWSQFSTGSTVAAIDFSASESLLATATNKATSSSGSTTFLMPNEGLPDGMISFDAQEIYDIEFNLTDQILYYTDADGRLMAYRRNTLTSEPLWQVPETQIQRIDDIALNPDGSQIALASWGLINIYDIEREEVVQTLEGHPYQITEVAFGPDGEWLVSVDGFGTVMFWDTATWEEIVYLPNQPASSLAISPASGLVAVGGETITLVDPVTHTVIAELEPHGPITDMTFSEDGTRLIGASSNGKIYIWGVPSAE